MVEFSVGTGRFDYKTKERTTDWVRCSWWGTRAEKLAPSLTKGSKILVRGTMVPRAFEGKHGPQVSNDTRVEDVELLGGGKRDDDGVPF